MLDGLPLGDPAQLLPAATVKPSRGPLAVSAMVREAIDTAERIIDELHADTETAAKAGDIGTADLYTRFVQVHQKQRWFLLQIERKKDGLGA
jgi:starvation-inducible DNA-binding protein